MTVEFDSEVVEIVTEGAPSISWRNASIGTSVSGVVTKAALIQETDYDTGSPLTWPNGDPKMQLVVTLVTNLRDASRPDDDGARRLYCKGSLLFELKKTLKAMNLKGLIPGGTLTVTFSGEKPASNPRHNPVKLYTVAFVPPGASAAAAPVQAPAAAAPAATAPAQTAAAAPASRPPLTDAQRAEMTRLGIPIPDGY